MEADEQLFMKLQQGYRMEKPKYCPTKIYDVMMDCWLHDPPSRPNFTSLSEQLGSQLETSVRRHYIDLNDAYIESNNAVQGPDYLRMMSPVDYVNVASQSSPMPPRPTYENLPSNNADNNG